MIRPVLCLALGLAAGACAAHPDVGPEPAMADVRIHYVEMQPKDILQAGKGSSGYRSEWTTLAYSSLDRANKFCLVVLPPKATTGAEYWERLRVHEVRHCHGELHPDRARFSNDFAFASAE